MSSHAYWRINCTQTGITPTNFGCAELTMRDTSGGAQVATGGTAITSSEFGFAPASNAFDGNTGSSYLSSSQTMPQYLGYHFASPIELAEMVFRAQSGPSTAPIAFTLDYSDDGSSWTTCHTGAGAEVAAWSANEERTFPTGFTGSGGTPPATARPVVSIVT